MTATPTDWIPSELVSHVSEGCSERGKQWLIDLKGIIAKLERHWSITALDPFPGIEYNYVAPAITTEGKEVVLKIAPPWEPVEIFGEAQYLRIRDGHRCVRLIDLNAENKAILIERIRPGIRLFERFADDPSASITPAIDVLKASIGPIPAGVDFPTSFDDWWANFARYPDTDFPADYASKALALYEKLAKGPGCNLYLHGDFHPGNVVTDDEQGFILIDPKGIRGHIGYEISVFLNNFHWWLEANANVMDHLRAAVGAFSTAFEIPEMELRQWCYLGMVIGAWWNYVDMPALYDGSVTKADIWDII